jgi:DNA/RNA endonuclease YhcR with UshA esterase domain
MLNSYALIIIKKIMFKLSRLFLIVFTGISSVFTPSFAQTLAQWDFDINTSATTSTANATVSTAAWSLGTMTFPAGNSGNSADKALSTTGFNAATINTNKYLQFTVTPHANYAMVLNSISFYDQKSATGPTTWVLRSSLDNYTANLNTSGVPNTLFSATPNVVELGINFQNINNSITFRLYAYGATSSAGTWRIDDLTIEGSLFDVSNPIINASKTAISFSTILVGTPSVSSAFIAAGFGLTGDLTVSAPTGYEISESQSTGYASNLIFTPVNNTVSSKIMYVRLKGILGNFNSNITLTSPNVLTKTIALNGDVINQPTRTNIATIKGNTNGTYIFTGGRVTVATEFSPNQLFIQDNSGGIAVFNSAKNIATEYALQLGDSVEIFGYKSAFNGLKQITLLSLNKINTPQYSKHLFPWNWR